MKIFVLAVSACMTLVTGCNQPKIALPEAEIIIASTPDNPNLTRIPSILLLIDGVPMQLALDTGADALLLNADSAEDAGFDLEVVERDNPSIDAVDLTFELENGRFIGRAERISVVSLPILELLDLDGVIDPRLLSLKRCGVFNFRDKTIHTWEKPISESCQFPSFPNSTEKVYLPEGYYTWADVGITERVRVFLDTGSSLTTIQPELLNIGAEAIQTVRTHSLKETQTAALYGAIEVSFSEITVPTKNVLSGDALRFPMDSRAIIGFDVLSEAVLLIDGYDHEMWIEF